MVGIYFYWFIWMFWIGTTFFMEKGKTRTLLSMLLLVVICTATLKVPVLAYDVSVAFLLCLGIGYAIIALGNKAWRQLYLLIVSLIIALVGISFHLFELYDPIIILFHRSWMLGIIYTLLVIALVSNHQQRLSILVVGACQGELMTSLFMDTIYVNRTIGDLAFFEIMMITVMFLVIWQGLENASDKLSKFLSSRVKNQKEEVEV
ncbi:hypothetical protein [Bacillus alkalicellulosilyticus]|uniref:YphA family membrane protein n=1 Tax=Alkalihalobacterium alkalicellulosilyticum TaxID=1912214 RepID=UPI000997FFD8|nr:hypothetical protein [Bacillus alkalicellulosilyticus]